MNAKRFFKQNTHNALFKALAGFGRSLNRLYENRNYDVHSNGELTILRKLSKHNPSVILDGGANVGKYALLVSELNPHAQIYAFEPVKSTFEQLTQNTSHRDNIFAVNKGLYKDNCAKEINVFASDAHASLVDIQGLNYSSHEKKTIELIKGDDFLRGHNIEAVDFLKLDVEGAEFDAMQGFEAHIDSGAIKMIQFEYGYINISTKILLLDYYQYFERKGYVLGKIFPKTVEFRKYAFKYEDFMGPNMIAVKKTETQLIKALSEK